MNDFPGRIFQVKDVAKQEKANIIVRNYPMTVEEIKKKTGIKDGGEIYLLCFTGTKKKFMVVADRLK